jgi:hypothetical protein
MICKDEICCLEITVAARIVGVLGMVSTRNIKHFLETKEHAIIYACYLFTLNISKTKTSKMEFKMCVLVAKGVWFLLTPQR